MQSETVGALAAALAKAQGQIRPAPMDRDNPFFKSRYATLTSLWESARAALAANGLAVTQATDLDNAGNIVLITTLMHSSGEWVGSVYPVRPKDNAPQTIGSAITYARRYAFSALVGLSSDDDDDGNAANGNGGNHAPAKQQEVRPAKQPAAPQAATISGGSQTSNGNGGGVAGGNGKAYKPTGAALDFLAACKAVFGPDEEPARHWLIKRYSAAKTPENVRESTKDMTDDELRAITRTLTNNADRYASEWAAANMDTSAVPSVADADPIAFAMANPAVMEPTQH